MFSTASLPAKHEELVEAELCAELVQEAKGLAAQADSLRKRDQSKDPRPVRERSSHGGCQTDCISGVEAVPTRHAHWEEAAVLLPAAITTEGALRERVERLSEQEYMMQSQARLWGLKFTFTSHVEQAFAQHFKKVKALEDPGHIRAWSTDNSELSLMILMHCTHLHTPHRTHHVYGRT